MTIQEQHAAAVAREQRLRNIAFLRLPVTVCGEELHDITPHSLAVLTVARSPFICGGAITHSAVLVFLWALNVRYASCGFRAWSYRRKLARKIYRMNLAYAAGEIERFVADTFMDAPCGTGKPELPVASDTAWMVYRFETGAWRRPAEVTMHTPFRILYQELKCYLREHTEQPIISPSNKFIATMGDVINECRRRYDAGEREPFEINGRMETPFSQERLNEWNDKWRKERENKGNN